MLDEIVPGSEDVDVSLLYQTPELNSIKTGDEMSTVTRQGASLNIFHLAPQKKEVSAVETPHYLITLQKEKPLVKEGMIMLTARTAKEPLIAGNLFVSSDSGHILDIRFQHQENFVYGEGAGRKIVFRTKDKTDYIVNDFKTDALAMVWNEDTLFVVNATNLLYQNELILSADAPVSAEIYKGQIHYAATRPTRLKVPVQAHTEDIILNGRRQKIAAADKKNCMVEVSVPEGNGIIKTTHP